MITIKNDGLLDIATGRSRNETRWRNKETTWSALVNKLSVTHRTAETVGEYASSAKARQDEIKDIGGFVGGYVNGGRRKATNILHRQLITLDLDFTTPSFWDNFTLFYGNAAALYSTHKHTAEKPRLRLVLPLDRAVGSDEYIAIARRIAGNLGINEFDDTTFAPERLMYWPSTSKDGEYLFEHQDGEWLCADEVLGSYRNWQDTSEWPISDRVGEAVRRGMTKQGDPTEKPGMVGAFCRTYGIQEAIETYLSEDYEPCAIEGRYTYKQGSTSGGLVVYEDRFAYSHHGTDPSSGRLCNAFDLVRLHKFADADENTKENTPINKLPSFSAMSQLAASDVKVKRLLGVEKMQELRNDFEELIGSDAEGSEAEPEEVDDSWLELVDVDGKGNYRSTINNIRLILDNDPALKGKLALNAFEKREITRGRLPWRTGDEADNYLADSDDSGLRHYLEKNYNITGIQKIKDGLDLTVKVNAFHPVRDYLAALKWDGSERIDTLFIDYLGAEDSQYTRAVTRKSLVAAVARVFRPGCKYDYVPVLVGPEGVYKSSILKKLGREWFSDSFSTVQGKEAFEQLQGVWIMEMAELAGLKKAEVEATKHFISKQEDRYRVAYGRRLENFPRQCVMFGTTNNADFLRGDTGNRRFWPIDTRVQQPSLSVVDDLNDYAIDQIWAEAVKLFEEGETLYLPKDIENEARTKQEAHSESDERVGVIEAFANLYLPENWAEMSIYERHNWLGDEDLRQAGKVLRNRLCVAEIWCELFRKPQSEMNKFNTKDLHNILRGLKGWEPMRNPQYVKMYGRQRCYKRIGSCTHEDESEGFGIHDENKGRQHEVYRVYREN